MSSAVEVLEFGHTCKTSLLKDQSDTHFTKDLPTQPSIQQTKVKG